LNVTQSDWLQGSLSHQKHQLIGYNKVVCDVRNTINFKPCVWDCLWFTAVL